MTLWQYLEWRSLLRLGNENSNVSNSVNKPNFEKILNASSSAAPKLF